MLQLQSSVITMNVSSLNWPLYFNKIIYKLRQLQIILVSINTVQNQNQKLSNNLQSALLK